MSPLLDFFTDWLIQTATIQRAPAAVLDDTGSGRKDYVAIETDVPCQLQAISGAFLRQLYGDNPASSHTLYLHPTVDIRAGDRVLCEGETWLVEDVDALRDNALDHLEARLSRILPI